MAKKALGKGLGAIISTSATPVEDMEKVLIGDCDRIVHLDINRVIPNPDQHGYILMKPLSRNLQNPSGLQDSCSPL